VRPESHQKSLPIVLKETKGKGRKAVSAEGGQQQPRTAGLDPQAERGTQSKRSICCYKKRGEKAEALEGRRSEKGTVSKEREKGTQ